MIDIIARAVKLSGGPVALARKLGISHQSFYSWKKVPAERVLDFERATGIPKTEIRPDLYPPRKRPAPEQEAAA